MVVEIEREVEIVVKDDDNGGCWVVDVLILVVLVFDNGTRFDIWL